VEEEGFSDPSDWLTRANRSDHISHTAHQLPLIRIETHFGNQCKYGADTLRLRQTTGKLFVQYPAKDFIGEFAGNVRIVKIGITVAPQFAVF